MSNKNPSKKTRRREFLANLLFAGGALSVLALQGELLAQTDPEEEGWELPKDWKNPNPQQSPKPQPTKAPPPQLLGDVAPPLPPGKVQPPRPRPTPPPKS